MATVVKSRCGHDRLNALQPTRYRGPVSLTDRKVRALGADIVFLFRYVFQPPTFVSNLPLHVQGVVQITSDAAVEDQCGILYVAGTICGTTGINIVILISDTLNAHARLHRRSLEAIITLQSRGLG